MTAADFRAWLAHLGHLRGRSRPISEREAAEMLGWSRGAVRRVIHQNAAPPRYIGFACSAILHGLPEWRSGE